MGKLLDTWLDDECQQMTIALSMTPERPSAETQEMIARFRAAMMHSYHGETLLLMDRCRDLLDAVIDALPRPLRWWFRR